MIENIIITIISIPLSMVFLYKLLGGNDGKNEPYRAWFIQSEALDNQIKK